MNRKGLAFGIILLFIGTCIIPAIAQDTTQLLSTSRGNWLYVGGSGPGNYTYIQDAIFNASWGDTVFVYNGNYTGPLIYNLSYIFIYKEINLIGESQDATIINCPDSGTDDYCGIFIQSSDVSITGFTIIGAHHQSSIGIYVSWTDNSYIKIQNCTVYSFACGVELENGYNSLIKNCTTYDNQGYGGGIYILTGDHISVIGCNSYSNSHGIFLEYSDYNSVYHNNLFNNTVNAFSNLAFNSGEWYNSTLQEGNYYDDYTGQDNNGDGIGDTPYNITGGDNLDIYPLMNPLTSPPIFVWVDDNYTNSIPGWGYFHFSSIQAGIDAVDVGGTVYVYSGTYYENVVVDKESINLIGEKRDSTIIDGEGNTTIQVTASNISVIFFTICNGTNGIAIQYSSTNIISDCNIYNNAANGIFLDSSNYTIISNCDIHHNYYYDSVFLVQSSWNTIRNCNLSWNVGSGVCLWFCSNNNIITQNLITNNSVNGVRIVRWNWDTSDDNQIYHNNFINNSDFNGHDLFSNYWDNGYPSGGNYWDDYTGLDTNGDGIGDTPYNISGGSNQDLYPLMHPFELYYLLNISLDNHEVNEGTTFNVTVKTVGGTVVPNAQVVFNGEMIVTGSDGIAVFTAPSVPEDIVYPIVASKPGYTSDNDTILVKNVPQELGRAFIFGRYTNLTEEGGYTIIEADNLRLIFFKPYQFIHYVNGEMITLDNSIGGFVVIPTFKLIIGFSGIIT